MKVHYTSALCRLLSICMFSVLITLQVAAQTPQAIPYQAVARNSAGSLLASQGVALRFTIHNATSGGTIVYRETQSATTNTLGLFTVKIGQGTPVTGTFSGISWGSGLKFLQVEIDPAGGVAYTDMGTTQMMSVPYALYAENANVPGVAGPPGSANISGTVNRVIKFTGATTGGNSLITDDGNGVGIGTTLPNARLDVSTNSNYVSQFNGNAPMYNAIFEGGVYRGYWGSYSGNPEDVDFGTGNFTTGKVHLTTQTIPRLTVGNTGNVGIGTTEPAYKMHVSGGDLFVESNSGSIRYGYLGGPQWKLSSTLSGGDMLWSNINGGPQTTHHFFSSNGKVGFCGFNGSAAPIAALDVISPTSSPVDLTLFLRNSNNDTAMMVSSQGNISMGAHSQPTGSTLSLYGNGINFFTSDVFHYSGGIASTDTSLILYTSNMYPNQYISLQPFSGNAGVGTPAPSAKFHVNGSFKLTDGSQGTGKILTSDATGMATWIIPPTYVGGSGATNYLPKWSSSSALGNSIIQDNGQAVSIGVGVQNAYKLYVTQIQQTANGDGQAAIFGWRDRDIANPGLTYGASFVNSGSSGYNFWGDPYSFGVTGHNYNDYTRTGGTLGAEVSGSYWGSMGYRSSASLNYGVYGSAAYSSGGGALPEGKLNGVGGGFFGTVGSLSKGSVIGQLNEGELFAAYNKGDVYTSGKQIELVSTDNQVIPSYAVTSSEITVYKKGTVQLVDGKAFVRFPENYSQLLGETPVVTASPMGACNGVYVASISKEGFEIIEQNNGQSSVQIGWIAVGNRIDAATTEVPGMLLKTNFNRNLSQALFNDGNRKQSGLGMWWDGHSLQFGDMPADIEPSREQKMAQMAREKAAVKSVE